MTALFLGELVSLSNTADVSFGVGWSIKCRDSICCLSSLLVAKVTSFQGLLTCGGDMRTGRFSYWFRGYWKSSLFPPVPHAGSPEKGCLQPWKRLSTRGSSVIRRLPSDLLVELSGCEIRLRGVAGCLRGYYSRTFSSGTLPY